MEVAHIMGAKVRDVMTPGPIGVDYYQTIGETARTMRDWGVGAVLVVHDQMLYGLVTDRDLVVRAVAEASGPDGPVGPVSSANVIGVDVDAEVYEAGRLMRENHVRRLPVIEDGQVTGVVTLGDVAMEHDHASALAAISLAVTDRALVSVDEAEATRLVRERAVRRIPVLADGAAVGIVHLGDLAPAATAAWPDC